MFRLFGIIYTLAATTLAGSAVVAALTVGLVEARSIIVAALIGSLLAAPLAWVVTRRISD